VSWPCAACGDALGHAATAGPRAGPPATSIRNTSSPHWCGWLKPEKSCLVPANSFVECQSDAGDPDDG